MVTQLSYQSLKGWPISGIYSSGRLPGGGKIAAAGDQAAS